MNKKQNLLAAENTKQPRQGNKKQAQQGNKNLSGLYQAVIKNIDACKELSTITRTSLGPYGTNKLVYKLFLNELVVQHPAAKLLVLAAKEQQKKLGDGANLVVSIAGQHLKGAKELITTCWVRFEAFGEEGSATMDGGKRRPNVPSLFILSKKVIFDQNLRTVLMNGFAKLFGCFSGCLKTFRGKGSKVDTVVEIKRIENANNVLVIAGGVDTTATETNLIHKLGNYAKTEETKVEELIKESGAKVIVSGAGVGQMALQFCNHPSYLGYVDSILVEETPGARVTVTNEQGGVATVLLGAGASTDIISDEQLERAVVNVVNTYKALCRDSRIVPGAGATEIEIARRLKEFAFKETRSSNQIVIAKYAESFELIPKTLAHNANLNVEGIIETLYADHAAGNVKAGIDYKNEDCKDASTLNIWDLYTTKQEPQSIFDRLMSTLMNAAYLSFLFKLNDDADSRIPSLTYHECDFSFWSKVVYFSLYRVSSVQYSAEAMCNAVSVLIDVLR
ncbi:T-complex protein 1 subunit theta-like protein [Tanacetum coccineum]